MWDEECSVQSPPVINHASNGYEDSQGSSFYVGRGRGFYNMSSMASDLPTNEFKPKVDQSSAFQDDAWNESPSNNNDSWQSSSYNYESRQDNREYSSYSNKGSISRKQNQYQKGGGRSRACHKCNKEGHIARDCPNGGSSGGRGCFKCNEEGHMSRDCPKGGGGGRACFKCSEEGHMSRDCPNAGSGGGGRACFKCSEEGHMSRDCPNAGSGGGGRACFKCKEEGHMSRDCPNAGSGGDIRACFKCKEEGHMSRDCPNAGSGGQRGNRACHKCHEEGHMARDCPNAESSGNSRGCFKCKKEGHMAKDCTEEVLGEDGKPRPPPYVPPEPTDDEETLFQGVPMGINFTKYDNINVDVSGEKAPPPIDSFENSRLNSHLLKNILRAKYTKPTPVQKYAIPIIMDNRDLMACAQTGSGKTAAFLLPMLHAMITDSLPNNRDRETQEPWALIIAPTRELVIQIGSEARKFSHDSVIQVDVVYGGTSVNYQSNRIRRGCHLLVATPGRLLDFVEKGKVSFNQLRYLVLDEADRMLDMGFAPAVRKMVEHSTMPEKGLRQTLMFSATFPEDIQTMASEFLQNYLFLTVGMVGAANTDVLQQFHNLGQFDKKNKLLEILQNSGMDRTLVFVEQKRTADFIATLCSQSSLPTTSIHGDRLQREREEALRDFRVGRMPILVATAVAARGLDIRDVRHVINYDLPKTIDEYVHRIGRTGRVGNTGIATSFYDTAVDQPLARSLKKILIDAQQEIPDWLSEEANNASDTTVQYGGRGNFGARDVRNQGRNNRSSDEAFDNYSQNNFSEPANVEESW